MFKIIFDETKEDTDHKVVFANTIESLVSEDEKVIYLDADLINASGSYEVWKKHPSQVINCGIAEANMMGIAAGLSAVGFIPYVHTFGPFATRRCFDQVYLSIAYAGNDVRIFGSDPGITAEFNGGTHMPFEDMALMRSIPNAYVMDAADGVQLEAIIRASKQLEGVVYFRAGRKRYKKIYAKDSKFTIGKANVIRPGTDLTIVACGLMLGEAMSAAQLLADQGISVEVIDMFTVKPLDSDLLIESAKKTGCVVSTENHSVIGGLGDAVASCLMENGIGVPFAKHGVQDRFGQVGPLDYLQKQYGLTATALADTCQSVVQRKHK